MLPHRPPFLFVDRVVEGSAEQVVALKTVRAEEPYFGGHFPGDPVMPGVLIAEAMAQASLILYAYNFELEDKLYLVTTKARFLSPVFPNDELRLVARKVRFLKKLAISSVEAFVGDRQVARAELGFAAAPAEAD